MPKTLDVFMPTTILEKHDATRPTNERSYKVILSFSLFCVLTDVWTRNYHNAPQSNDTQIQNHTESLSQKDWQTKLERNSNTVRKILIKDTQTERDHTHSQKAMHRMKLWSCLYKNLKDWSTGAEFIRMGCSTFGVSDIKSRSVTLISIKGP